MVEAEVSDKVMALDEAVRKFVRDGDLVFIQWKPFSCPAAVQEIIRRRIRNLTITSAAFLHNGDLLIGAGCVKKVITGYFGAELAGLTPCFRRAIEQGIPQKIELEEYSNFDVQMMCLAGAMGIPFTPVRDILGTDYINIPANRRFKLMDCPFSGERVVLLPALTPDVGLIQAQRADSEGNVQTWGAGMEFGIHACNKVIACVEEICDREIIRRDPDRTLLPSHKVMAVVHEPWGGHPEPLYGYYNVDLEWEIMAIEAISSFEGFDKFMNEWVYGISNRREYIHHYVKKYGYHKLESLRPKPYLGISVDYGLYSEKVIR